VNEGLHISLQAETRLTQPWEEFVAYPYDDQRPKCHQPDGSFRYTPWDGGARRGTITIGFGHTDAAGDGLVTVCGLASAHIVPGITISRELAVKLLAYDMRPCERDVKSLVKVPLGQHQADTLFDFVFNAGKGTLAKSTLLRLLNAGNYDAVPRELLKFTYAHNAAGQLVQMRGLMRRRQAQIAWWNTPDDHRNIAAVPLSPAEHGVDDDDLCCPKGALPPQRSVTDSKSVTSGLGTIAAGGGVIATAAEKGGGVIDVVQQAGDTVAPVQDKLVQLGLWDQIVAFVSAHPIEIGVGLMVCFAAFMTFDRVAKLRAEHV
jgi:lysozyme